MLTQCPGCGWQAHARAKACPRCGYPIAEEDGYYLQRMRSWRFGLAVTGLWCFPLSFLVAAVASYNDSPGLSLLIAVSWVISLMWFFCLLLSKPRP